MQIPAEAIVFYALTAITVLSGLVVVTSRKLVHSAFALVFAFSGLAGYYVLLSADFLAAAQVLIYVGGILILILFAVMLTHRIESLDIRSETLQLLPAIAGCGAIVVLMLLAVYRTPWAVKEPQVLTQTAQSIGSLFMTDYLLPFEVASVHLLIALVGAVIIAGKRGGP